jgi:hypothetical protein
MITISYTLNVCSTCNYTMTKWVYYILPPFKNIIKIELQKFDIFDSKSKPNTFTFDQFFLIFWNSKNTFHRY